MVTTETNPKRSNKSLTINRFMYGAFVLLSAYFIFIQKDYGTGMANMGIALIFDPFNPEVTWNKRPTWQKVWLFIHVAVVFGLLGVEVSSFL
jgi:H+/Cl- antiporter ClcA